MSLQIWLPLNEDIHNQGLMNISFTNDNAIINNNGKIGKCYYFDKSENSMIKNNNDIPTHNWSQGSLCCWVKLNTFPNDSTNPKWAPMLFLGTSGLYANSIFGLVFEYSNYINISIHGSTTGKNAYKHNLITDTWYHICTTYDGSLVKLYINGQEVMSKTAILGTFTSDLSTLYIGGNPSYILNGYLNDCRYYDHCLSAKEVEEISKGLISHFKLNNNGYSNLLTSTTSRTVTVPENATNAYTSYWYFDTNIKNNNLFIENTFYTILYDYSVNNLSELSTSAYLYSQLNTSRCSPVKSQIQFRTENTGHVIETFAVDANQADYASSFRFRIRLQSANPGDSITISNLRIYLGTQEEIIYIVDSSGYKKTGVAQLGLGMTTVTPSPKYMQAMMFDGRDWIDQIYPRNFPIDVILTEYSFSYWLYLSETAEQNQYIIANPICQNYIRDSSSSYPNCLFINWLKYVDDSTESNNSWAPISIISYLNQWIHICIVFDGDMHLYVNGELSSTSERGGFIKTVNRGQSIGYNAKTLQISDVREYVTALTAKQVKELYNTSMSIDNNSNVYARELVE